MTTPAPRPLALSPSRASDYQQCPLLYRLRAIDRLPEPKTLPQVRGNLVHAVLEYMHAQPREERTYPAAVKQLKPHWAEMVAADGELAELVPESALLDFLIECRSLLRGYFEMENPQGFDAHAVEMYVDTVLPNGVPVRGFIDRVDVAPTGEVRVVDYKTGKKPLPRYSHDAQFQMRFYALVYWRLYGVIPHQLRLMYLKVLDSMFLAPSKEELEYFERDLGDLWGKIAGDGQSGSFRPKTSKLCGWCSFQSLCPAFGGTPPEYPGWPGSTAD
ncbi:RecB family exonuclease [Corynebacterium sp.]|uniref:RecB family exonuclease n=1 Tax=Corynebacterium sp. TaxID=1720 RepID=UPI0019B1C186|nr:RecB family exonuclease [Corynebacterium sp.]HHU67515.1 RecB family exonuclease [Corynebacterium sp.]